MRLMVSVTKEAGDVLSFDETYIQGFRCYERLSGLDATLDRPVSDLIGATPEFKAFESEFDNMIWDHDLGTINRRTVSTPPYYFRILIENAAETEYLFQNDCIGLPIVVSFETEPDEGEESPVSDVSNTRYFRGVILKSFMRRGNKLGSNRLELCAYPDLWAMSVSQKSRVWSQVSGFSVLQDLTTEYAPEFPNQPQLVDKRYNSSGKFIREAVIQWQETDFEFLSRLLEGDGQYYSIIHPADQSSLYLMSPEHPPIIDISFVTKPLRFEAGNEQQSALFANVLLSVSKESRLVARKYSASDYNPLNASTSLSFSTLPENGNTTALEVYDYPADAGEVSSLEAAALRRNRAIQNRRNVHVLCSKSPMVMPGVPVNAELNLEALEGTELRPTQVVHELVRDRDTQTLSYLNWFEAILATVNYAPMVRTAIPSINGTHNAKVTSNTGLVADIDDQSRALVLFEWDRERKPVRVRLGQSWAGGGHGIHALPREGDEVLVSFIQGNTERPIVITSLHNSQTAKKFEPTRSLPLGFQGDSDPGVARPQQLATAIHDSRGNAIYFNDSEGDELLKIDAAKDFILEIGSKIQKGRNIFKSLPKEDSIEFDSTKTRSEVYPSTEFVLNEDLEIITGETVTLSVKSTSKTILPNEPTPASAMLSSATEGTNWSIDNDGKIRIGSELCKPFSFEIDCTNDTLIDLTSSELQETGLLADRENLMSAQTLYSGSIHVGNVVALNKGYIANLVSGLPAWTKVAVEFSLDSSNNSSTSWSAVEEQTISLYEEGGRGEAASHIHFQVLLPTQGTATPPTFVRVKGFCYPHYVVSITHPGSPLGSFVRNKEQRGTGIVRTYGDLLLVVGKKSPIIEELRDDDGAFTGWKELGATDNLLSDGDRGDFKLHVMGEMDQFAESFYDSNYSPTHGLLYDATYKAVRDFAGLKGIPVFSTASMSRKFNVNLGWPNFDFNSGFQTTGNMSMESKHDFGGTLTMNDINVDVTWTGVLQIIDALIDGNSNKFKTRFAMLEWEAGTQEHVIADAIDTEKFYTIKKSKMNKHQTLVFHGVGAGLRTALSGVFASFGFRFSIIVANASASHGADKEDDDLKKYLRDTLPGWSESLQIMQYVFLALVVVSGLGVLYFKLATAMKWKTKLLKQIAAGVNGTGEIGSTYEGANPFQNYLMEQSSGIVKNAISTDKKLTYLKANNLVKIVKSKLSKVEEKVSDVKISVAKTNMKMVTQQAAINNVKNKLQKTNNKLTIVNTNLLKNQAKLENTEVSIATLAAKIANAKVKISRNKSVLLDFS